MKFLFAILLCLAVTVADAAPNRSGAARRAFVAAHACPSTGLHKLPCPGHVIDHIKPRCDGGPDAPENMQWQTYDDAAVKDNQERATCRANRRARRLLGL